jgi:diguanylate cyclase (GGDEF)-like protein/PAS domain S-box-containing protein
MLAARFNSVPLGKQIAAICVFGSLLAVALVSTVDGVLINQHLRAELDMKATLYARQLRQQLAPVVAFDDAVTAREILESLALDPDVAGLAAYSAGGEVIEGVGLYPQHLSAGQIPAKGGKATIVVIGDVSSPEGISGQLYVSLSKARIHQSMISTMWSASCTAAVALLMALALVGPIAKRITGRLSRLVEVAACIARGDFTHPVIEHGSRDEIGVLASAVNTMSTDLRRMFAEVDHLHEARHARDLAEHAKLERMVTERTATLRESQAQTERLAERFALAADAAGIGVWELDWLSNVLLWDEQMYRLYGLAPTESTQPYSLWADSLHAEDRERTEQEFAAAVSGTQKFDAEFRIVLPNQEVRYIKAHAKVQRDAAGLAVRMAGVNFDITSRKSAENALQQSERNFHSLFDFAPSGMALTDLQTGQFLQVNDAFVEPTGFTRQELLGMTLGDLRPERARAALESLTSENRRGPLESEQVNKNGASYAVLISSLRLREVSGREVKWSIVQDISQRKAMESKLVDAAQHDKLTGLANRATFMEKLDKAVLRVRAGQQPLFAVLFLDFDRFKLVNDTLGHDAGDELLRQISRRLQRELRASDTLADTETGNVVSRFGGDEFLLLINDLKLTSDAMRIADRLLGALAPRYEILGSEVHSTASIGIVTSEEAYGSAEDVVRDADVAMYEAKRAGRACSVLFSHAMQTRLTRHVSIETNLRRAIGTEEIFLVYQPIVELATGKLVSTEALVRWNHPTLGVISPGEFVPIAEETNLIVALGQWVQRTACQAMAAWRREDPLRAPKTISVNVSRAELALGPRLLEQIQGTLAEFQLPAGCLQLEVTEREMMRNPEAFHQLMHDLQGMGVRMAMDDFGTGTSSLGYLRSYPFDTIKIDGSFMRDLTRSGDVLAVVHATINLVENLGMASLAECVEEPAQVAILQSLGCRYAQGYFFSAPVGAELLLDAVNGRTGMSAETTLRTVSSASGG